MNIIRQLKLADFLTMANLWCGVSAVIVASKGYSFLASILILSSVFFDLLDGRIARYLNQVNMFGKELDSLSDIVSFGIGPVALFFSLSSLDALSIFGSIFFVSCAMLRLARFNIKRLKHFEGVPITVNGILFPFLFFLKMVLPDSLALWPFIFIVMGILMVSAFKVRKVF